MRDAAFTKVWLEAQIKALRAELDKIEEAEEQERNAGLIGRCYRYRNTYSCASKPSDYWFMYGRVLSVEGHSATVLMFQTDSGGQMTLHPKECHSAAMLAGAGAYQQITRKEYDKALRAFLAKASRLAKEAGKR